MKRVEDDWVMMDEDTRGTWNSGNDLTELIPFTEDRYQTLLGIKESFTRVAVILNGMFGEKVLEAGKSAAMLDAMSGQKLLAAPPEPPPKTKGRKR
jgi:hypothetical protein